MSILCVLRLHRLADPIFWTENQHWVMVTYQRRICTRDGCRHSETTVADSWAAA